MKSISTLAAILLLSGCASLPEAQFDYDYEQVFSTYRTFAWLGTDPLIHAAVDSGQLSPLNRRRIQDAIEAELLLGFKKVAEVTEADFVVSYTVGARDRIDVTSYPAAYQVPWRWGRPFFGSSVDARAYRDGTLAIDAFDAKSHRPVWHGWATKEITQRDIKHEGSDIPKVVAKILFAFPPPDGEPGC